MGRKKSRRTTIKKRSIKPSNNKFDCPKCNHEKVVSCKINKNCKIGTAYCSVCESIYKCEINSLDQFVDIYHKWIDELTNK